MYDPASKIAYQLSSASAQQYSSVYSDANSISQYNPGLFSSSQVINGMECDVFQYKVLGVINQMWVSKQYGLPVRVVAGSTTMDYTNFSFPGITDSMFQLPADAIMVTIPGV